MRTVDGEPIPRSVPTPGVQEVKSLGGSVWLGAVVIVAERGVADFDLCSFESHVPRVSDVVERDLSLFQSYYRVPTRPEWRERDLRLSLGSLGLGTESAVRFWVHFGLLFLPFRRPLEPHGHSGNAKICGLVSKMCKGSVSVMKTV